MQLFESLPQEKGTLDLSFANRGLCRHDDSAFYWLYKAQNSRSFATPPEAVQVVCECVAIIKGLKEINWKTAKGMMADPYFLRSLMELNVDAITGTQIRAIRAHMRSRWTTRNKGADVAYRIIILKFESEFIQKVFRRQTPFAGAFL
uniref:Uncharacterized protein n=1 Tax=Timema monikensis TaxID=170555 RepID=A0A7R9E8B7_9NEOP|nr:unnamed protein product [Timema monikensis]